MTRSRVSLRNSATGRQRAATLNRRGAAPSVEELRVVVTGLVVLLQAGEAPPDDPVAPDVVRLGQDEEEDVEAAEPDEALVRGVIWIANRVSSLVNLDMFFCLCVSGSKKATTTA